MNKCCMVYVCDEHDDRQEVLVVMKCNAKVDCVELYDIVVFRVGVI